MHIQSFYKILSVASGMKAHRSLAVARADDEAVLDAVVDAHEVHMTDSYLIGRKAVIRRILTEHDIDPADYEIIDEDDDSRASRQAVQLVREGKADLLMKGLVSTGTLMKAVIDRDNGIRTDDLITHLSFYQPAGYKLVCLTDGGMNTFPDLEKKRVILEHAAQVFRAFNYKSITAACICGAETVNPKVQSMLDAVELTKMNDYWQKHYSMTVYGPVGLDLAISRESVRHKHYPLDYAGKADILLVPNYEVGNAIGKAMTVFAHARSAGIVLGAQVPIVLVSRSDSVETKLTSIALGCILTR